jgi:hypothetical protein
LEYKGYYAINGCHCEVCNTIRDEVKALKEFYKRREKKTKNPYAKLLNQGIYPDNYITGHGRSY